VQQEGPRRDFGAQAHAPTPVTTDDRSCLPQNAVGFLAVVGGGCSIVQQL